MKLKSIIKKLNKSYSIVIIPNSNDCVKKLAIKAPFKKLLAALLLVLSITASLYMLNISKVQVQPEEVSKEKLQQQIQTLTLSLIEQNNVLKASQSQMSQLKTNAVANEQKINEFTKMYKEIADNYISKSSRGTTAKSKSSSQAGLDLIKLNKVVEQLNKDFNNDKQLIAELDDSKNKIEKIVNAIPTFIPAPGKITSPFGMRVHPIKKVNKQHEGVDISASKGDPIKAASAGVVEYSGYSSGYGYNVIINHQNGYRTLYAHASKLLVKSGEIITKGQKIALVGSTGLSTGPHLHFEIRINGAPVDPTEYINFK